MGLSEQEVGLSEQEKKEVKTLKVLAGLVVAWLVIAALGTLAIIVALLAGWLSVATSVEALLLCIIAATTGSSISALVSAAERISNGWELSSSKKYPRPEPKDKFVARMAPFFAVRPFLGSAVGFLAYVGIVGGYLIAVKNRGKEDFSQEALLFLTFLAGLFAKTFIEKLRAMFDTLFGKK